MSVHHAASEITAPDTDHLPAYWLFHEAVARAQLAAWLPRGHRVLVDISGPRASAAELAAQAGHTVLRVIDSAPGVLPSQRAAGAPGVPASQRGAGAAWTEERRRSDEGRRRLNGAPEASGGKQSIFRVVADSSRLSFLPNGCADGVIADDRVLSTHLAAETMMSEIARVLRPAGRVLACVDSLVLGMAVLADQHHWAHLVDLPHAEVVLVPWPDGTITRCYGPDQARELFSGAGLAVNWIRPRTVFSESMVTHVLRRDPASLPRLVSAELAARSDESLGAQLVISARKPRTRPGSRPG
jgi:hypothetical protein